jgi:carbon storage regulator CsrA
MLVLSRKCDAEICIGADITIKVLGIRKGQVKLGIEAPRGLSVLRGELAPAANRGQPTVEECFCRSQQSCFAKPHRRHS